MCTAKLLPDGPKSIWNSHPSKDDSGLLLFLPNGSFLSIKIIIATNFLSAAEIGGDHSPNKRLESIFSTEAHWSEEFEHDLQPPIWSNHYAFHSFPNHQAHDHKGILKRGNNQGEHCRVPPAGATKTAWNSSSIPSTTLKTIRTPSSMNPAARFWCFDVWDLAIHPLNEGQLMKCERNRSFCIEYSSSMERGRRRNLLHRYSWLAASMHCLMHRYAKDLINSRSVKINRVLHDHGCSVLIVKHRIAMRLRFIMCMP